MSQERGLAFGPFLQGGCSTGWNGEVPSYSLKRSTNGRPPVPGWRYAVHFHQPGPGVLPSSAAWLERWASQQPPHMTSLRPMPQASFDAYRLASARGYADDNVASGRWPMEAAFERALADFDQSLPQGLSTPNNYVYEIRDAALERTVGVIWFAAVEKNSIRSAFVYDVEVAEAHQRKVSSDIQI